mmetsp:Transcript_23211/g.27314  ORF Transcript_23211/g.27314 Transcript_23211/m.27314 type:complete len:260 (-) Transcript_23211:51-830(-)
MLRKAGIANSTGKDVFSHVVNDTSTHSAADDRWRQGILPDAVVDGKNLPASYLGAGMARFGGVASLIDFKTVAPGTRYEQNLPAGRSPFGAVVEQRQSDVNRDYHQTAKKMDAARGTPPDTIGPIELEMNTYGHEGEVIGPVLGAYGEFSQHAYELADLIATKRAHDFCELNNMGLKQAKSMFTRAIRRKWGLYAHRGWANLLLQRSRNLNAVGGATGTATAGDEESWRSTTLTLTGVGALLEGSPAGFNGTSVPQIFS